MYTVTIRPLRILILLLRLTQLIAPNNFSACMIKTGPKEPRKKIRRADRICAVPGCPGIALGLSEYCRTHKRLAPRPPVPVSCPLCSQGLARLYRVIGRLTTAPAKPPGRGRLAAQLDGEAFWSAVYTLESWIQHLAKQPNARQHLVNAGIPQPFLGVLQGGIRTLRPGTLEHRGLELVAKLAGVSSRTLRSRVRAFDSGRWAFLYWCCHRWPPELDLGGLVFKVNNGRTMQDNALASSVRSGDIS